MIIRADYHFHPNLSKNIKKAEKKCKKIWNKFNSEGINTVIITEHAYKNPKRAFDVMQKHKPRSAFCFPGIECISKEGVDIVVFSNNRDIYTYEELKPYKLPYFNLLDFIISKNNLHAYVTHPYTLGLTSIIKKLGKKAYSRALNLLKAVEISNGSFDNLYFLLSFPPLDLLSKSKIENIKKTKDLPKSDYPHEIKFLAAGSDAHHAEDIGNCYEFNNESNIANEQNIFKSITENRGKGKTIQDLSKKFSPRLLIKTAFTSLGEFLIKQKLKLNKK